MEVKRRKTSRSTPGHTGVSAVTRQRWQWESGVETRTHRASEANEPEVSNEQQSGAASIDGVQIRRSICPDQNPDVRVLLYWFKPPFPSGGGFAAASAGRGIDAVTSHAPQSLPCHDPVATAFYTLG